MRTADKDIVCNPMSDSSVVGPRCYNKHVTRVALVFIPLLCSESNPSTIRSPVSRLVDCYCQLGRGKTSDPQRKFSPDSLPRHALHVNRWKGVLVDQRFPFTPWGTVLQRRSPLERERLTIASVPCGS